TPCTSDALQHVMNWPGAGATAYSYQQFSNVTHVVAAGDVVEYDVFQQANRPRAGAVEIYNSDNSFYRNRPGWYDENGLSAHPAADLSAYAFNKWYHRKIVVPSQFIGKTMNAWYIDQESGSSLGGTTTALVDNVVVTNNGVVVAVAWQDGPPS